MFVVKFRTLMEERRQVALPQNPASLSPRSSAPSVDAFKPFVRAHRRLSEGLDG